VVILFGTNAVFHALWSPLFFRLRRPDWALIEVVFLWGSLVALVVGLRPISHQASNLIVPYLVWVSFAAYLNVGIVALNRPFARPTKLSGQS
jgi:translocator protein